MIRRARFAILGLMLFIFVVSCCVWVRGTRTKDIVWIKKGNSDSYRICSSNGRIIISVKPFLYPSNSRSWLIKHTRPSRRSYEDDFGKKSNGIWFQIMRWKSGLSEYHLPLWIPLIASLAFAFMISPIRRFRVKTLIIAMTILALILGFSASWHPEIPKSDLRTAF